jgi:hypothetical protein
MLEVEVVAVLGPTARLWMALLGSVLSLALAGVPLLFGVFCSAVAPHRGREPLAAYNLGVWLGPFYVVYLLFAVPKVQQSSGVLPPPPPPYPPAS